MKTRRPLAGSFALVLFFAAGSALAQSTHPAPTSPTVPPASTTSSVPAAPTSPLVPSAPTSPLVPSAPGAVTALPKPQPVQAPQPTNPGTQPTKPTRPGRHRTGGWTGPFFERDDPTIPSAIACTQAGAPIITVANATEVQIDSSGAWPMISFRQGVGGLSRTIGLNSPTLECTTKFGTTQGGFNTSTGTVNGTDISTLTCFRNGAIIAQQPVSFLDMSWAANKMTLNYHLRDGKETPSAASFDVTKIACLAEPVGQELVQLQAAAQ